VLASRTTFYFSFLYSTRCFTSSFLSSSLTMSLNLNATFMGSPGDLTAAQLYSGSNVHFAQLNWFERQWMAWYLWIGNPLIATGIASFILHEVRSLFILSRCMTDVLACMPRLSISVAAYRGSSSTPSHTSASGSYNPTRYLRERSSGSVRRGSSFPTSPLRVQL